VKEAHSSKANQARLRARKVEAVIPEQSDQPGNQGDVRAGGTHYLDAMTSRGRFARWAGAQSNSDLCKFGVLLTAIGAVPYWTARSGDFWLDPAGEFRWVLVAATVLPLLCAAVGGLLGWRRGRAAGKGGGLAVFLGGCWFAGAAVVLTVLRALVLLGLVIAFQAS
jgi:hypothetical protein